MPDGSLPKHIVIIGGGIVGVSTAYYLSLNPALSPDTTITIVEGDEIAGAASGYAGGFLGRDEAWHTPETKDLSELSFTLHQDLAREHDGRTKWGWRELEAYTLTFDSSKPHIKSPVSWLPHATEVSTTGDAKQTAQCMPKLLTRHLCSIFLAHPRATLVTGTAVELERGAEGGISGVKVVIKGDTPGAGQTEETIPCDSLVLAAGPWLGDLAARLLGEEIGRRLQVTGSQANSIILRPKEKLGAHAVFAKIHMGGEENENEPEVYCRPDGTVYFCGTAGPTPLPEVGTKSVPYPQSLKKLHAEAEALSPLFRKENGAEVVSEQACYLPNPHPKRAKPLIGPVPGAEGVWVGGGHGVWGVLQGPATGLVLSEMLLGQPTSIDVTGLRP